MHLTVPKDKGWSVKIHIMNFKHTYERSQLKALGCSINSNIVFDKLKNIVCRKYNDYAFVCDLEAAMIGFHRDDKSVWLKHYQLNISLPIVESTFEKTLWSISYYLDIRDTSWKWFKISPLYRTFKYYMLYYVDNNHIQSALLQQLIMNIITHQDVTFSKFMKRESTHMITESRNIISNLLNESCVPMSNGKQVFVITHPGGGDVCLGVK